MSAPSASLMEFAPQEVRDFPEDYELVPSEGWLLAPFSKPCRWMERRTMCRRDSVAVLNRSSAPGKSRWYHYCERHLYGRVIVNGQVCHWRRIR